VSVATGGAQKVQEIQLGRVGGIQGLRRDICHPGIAVLDQKLFQGIPNYMNPCATL